MNDDSPFAAFVPPFAAFVPSTPEVTAPAETKNKKTRKARKKKAAQSAAPTVAPVVAPAPTKTKKERKPRTVKKERAIMLPISTLLNLGNLSDIETSAVSAIAKNLQLVPKKSRAKIVAALAKIFA